MAYFEQVEFVGLGAAVVVDTVLLLALTERHNLRHVTVPVVLLVLGAWLWHASQFLHVLLFDWTGPLAGTIHWTLMLAMSAGLLTMPSAMLHGLWRLSTTGFEPTPLREPVARARGTRQKAFPRLRDRLVENRHALCYLPLVLLAPIALTLARDPGASYMDLMQAWVRPYGVWLGLVNLVTAAGLFRVRDRFPGAVAESFVRRLAVALALVAAAQSACLLYALEAWPQHRAATLLVVTLSPALPALLFAYFMIRFNFMRLVLERSILYAAVLVAALLVHRALSRTVGEALAEKYGVDVTVLLAMLLIALVLAHRPLRQRAAEALRYLMGARLDATRRRARRLSLELSERTGRPPRELLAWFADAAGEALGAQWVGGWLLDERQGNILGVGRAEALSEEDVRALYRELRAHGFDACALRDAPSRAALDLLGRSRASLAVVPRHRDVRGLLLFGPTRRGRDLGQEEISAVALLAEQLAITLHSGQLQAERLAAERRALQSEKLSALGLLASSIAHEIKNPLSSIKTIATVMAEQLGPESEHAEDLQLILGEIDRLATGTAQLLQFARPAPATDGPAPVEPVLSGTLQVMRHLAKQRGVQLESRVADDLPRVAVDENALREIFFNLLSNAIDAAGGEGRVTVSCGREDGRVVARFQDSGPGIPPEVQDRLFEPFFTTKQSGTGLGLYVINRRARECGGSISCDSGPDRGTCFTVQLPLAPADDDSKKTAETLPVAEVAGLPAGESRESRVESQEPNPLAR